MSELKEYYIFSENGSHLKFYGQNGKIRADILEDFDPQFEKKSLTEQLKKLVAHLERLNKEK